MLSNPISSSAAPTRRGRRASAFVATTLLALIFGMCLPAQAQNAVLVLPDICDDPAGVFDYKWVQDKFGAGGLFVMQPTGTINVVDSQLGRPFHEYQNFYVAAHGGQGSIGGMSHVDFVSRFKAAHPIVPTSVDFAVCHAAQGPGSLLKLLGDAYGNKVVRLSGGVTGCALTGNGDPSLEKASYRINTAQSDPVRYDTIVKNIQAKWKAPYPGKAVNYKNYCQSQLAPFSAAGVKGFVDTVFKEFSAPDPAHSTNYLELIAINEKGDPLTVCGADPDGKGPVPCP